MIDNSTSEALDSLRGLAAILVFLAHFNQIFNLPIYGLNGASHLFFGIMASYAVMIFFVLSGFLITWSILNNIEKNSRFDWFSYLLDRFIRIYPPFVFSVFIAAVIYYVISIFELHGSQSFRIPSDLYVARERVLLVKDNVVDTLLMLPGFYMQSSSISMNGPLWSIMYEWWMYIFAMLLTISVVNRKTLGGILFFAGVLFIVYQNNEKFIFFASVWCVGSLLALYVKKGIKIPASLMVPLFFFLVLYMALKIKTSKEVYIPYASIDNFFFQFSGVILLFLLFSLSPLRNILNVKILRISSSFSYTLYVFHFPVLLFFFSFMHEYYSTSSSIMRFFIFIAVSILIISSSKFLSSYLENTKKIKSMIRGLRYYLALSWIKL